MIAATRTAACGASCQRLPCTLREIRAADVFVESQPRLTVWIELLTVAHVAGCPRPKPRPEALAKLMDLPFRAAECVLAEAADRAIDSRYVLMMRDYQPERLAKHVAQVAGDILVGRDPRCAPSSERHWQAGRYRYVDVAEALQHWHGRRDRPHPATTAWAERGLALSGDGIDAQDREFRRRRDARLPGLPLLLGQPRSGTGRPLLDAAGRRLSASTDPVTRLTQAAAFLQVPRNWHQHVFSAAADSDAQPAMGQDARRALVGRTDR